MFGDFVAKPLIVIKVILPLQSLTRSQVSAGYYRYCLCTDCLAAVETAGLPPVRFKLGRSFTTHVRIDAGNFSWTTPEVQWKTNGISRWDDKIVMWVLIPVCSHPQLNVIPQTALGTLYESHLQLVPRQDPHRSGGDRSDRSVGQIGTSHERRLLSFRKRQSMFGG